MSATACDTFDCLRTEGVQLLEALPNDLREVLSTELIQSRSNVVALMCARLTQAETARPARGSESDEAKMHSSNRDDASSGHAAQSCARGRKYEASSPPTSETSGRSRSSTASRRSRRPVACHMLANTDTFNSFWAMERVWAELRDLEQNLDLSLPSSNDSSPRVFENSDKGAAKCESTSEKEMVVEPDLSKIATILFKKKVVQGLQNVKEALREHGKSGLQLRSEWLGLM